MTWILDEEVLAVLASIAIVSGVFAASQLLYGGRVTEPFSELGLLGPEAKIAGYPREVEAGSPFRLNVYIGNHEGRTAYYRVLIKLGDRASAINGSDAMPLPSEPIGELRAILTHNSSRIIPINVTLHEPFLRRRLVFELWIFNETSGAFVYHERWNQLWLNVTATTTATVTGTDADAAAAKGSGADPRSEGMGTGSPLIPTYRSLGSDLEDALAEAFMAIRRAEASGGNVTAMVALLNDALDLASYKGEGIGEGSEGDQKAEALSLANLVLSMEPEVSRLGMESQRNRLYATVLALSSASAVGLGLFAYLRRELWAIWAGIHRECRVLWVLASKGGSNGSIGLDNLERTIRDLIRSKERNSTDPHPDLEGLIESLVSKGLRRHEAAKATYRLAKRGAIRLVDPKPPESFCAYMASRHNAGFLGASFLVLLSILTVYASGLSPIIGALRIVLGSIFVLFLPGYSLIEALYPGEGELSPLERLALSIGLSLALVPLVGLALNYTPWGIRLDPTVMALSMLTMGLLAASSYRKFRRVASNGLDRAGIDKALRA
ncbi:MAG: DUF1616 domain-containing protein [Candidatus Bathyarchaeia archaeon]